MHDQIEADYLLPIARLFSGQLRVNFLQKMLLRGTSESEERILNVRELKVGVSDCAQL